MRHKLPGSHSIETVSLLFQGERYHISFSRFPNGNVAEVFVIAGKVGSVMQSIARDAGIVISIMLQNGMLLSDIQESMTKLDDGSPAGPLGAIIKKLNEEW